MSATSQPDAADRNLLLGILALQNNLIDRRQLVRAFDDWVLDKSQSLGGLLLRDGALTTEELNLVSALAARHLDRHAGDVEKSLAALSSLGSLRQELSQIADSGLQASLGLVAAAREDDRHADALGTLAHETSRADGERFRILRPHAKGGLGEVYVAEDSELHRQVALKQIQRRHADHPEARSRFVLEAEITGGLEHPGIVPVYGLGAYADGRPFYAMRFIKGDSLQEATDRFHYRLRSAECGFESLEFRKLLQRFIDVCNAIEYAHSRGVLHRDLKPGNIMLGKYGETLVVDWGLAKVQGRASDETISGETTLRPASNSGSTPTQMGAAIGTPAYMSPEQAAGRVDQLGPASDVYSLGATLYYVLTGQAPFGKDDLPTTLRKVQAGDFTRPGANKSGVPPALEATCLKAMSVAATNRYASPLDLANDVERWLADEPVLAHHEPLAMRTRRWLRKHPKSVTGLAATVLVGLTSTIVIAAVVSGKNSQLARSNLDLQRSNLAERQARRDADEKRQEADAAREQERLARLDEAQARRRAEGVTEYLVKTFRSPDPKRAGREITMAEVLDRSVKDMQDKFADDPLTKATLLNAIAQSYLGLGLYHESIPPLEEARELRQSKLGLEHPSTLTSMNNLASAYRLVGQLDRALPLTEETLKLRQEKLGPNHPDTLNSMNNLAVAFEVAGQLDQALPLYEETLKRRQEKLGPNHPDTLGSMNNLAKAYKSAGQLDRVLPLMEETLKLRQGNLGPDHPDTLTSMGNLAAAYKSAGQLDRALPLYQETLKLRQKKLGPEHPYTLASMNDLGLAYRSLGQLEPALPLLEETLKLRQKKLGPDHTDTLSSMNNLAMAYKSVGQLDRALPLLEETLKRRQAKLGPNHPDTLTSMNNLAAAYQSTDHLDRAVPLWEETLKLSQAKLGPEHPDTLALMNNLGLAYRSAGQPHRALPLLEETLKLRQTKLGPEHPDTLMSMYNLADTYVAAKQFAAAESCLRECLGITEQKRLDGWPLFITKSLLGAALAGQKKFDEAESLLVEGYEGMTTLEDKIPATSKPRLTEGLQRLVDLYTAWDKPEEAARWQKEFDLRKAGSPNESGQ